METQRGFTLIEVMIVVVVAAILASIAYPSYVSSVRKAQRTDAKADIARLQILQEKHRSNHTQYAINLTDLGVPAINSQRYNFSTSVSAGTEAIQYTITAAAKNDQVNDNEKGVSCANLVLTVNSGNENYQPTACW